MPSSRRRGDRAGALPAAGTIMLIDRIIYMQDANGAPDDFRHPLDVTSRIA